MRARFALVALLGAEALASCSHAKKAEQPAPPPASAAETGKSGVPPRGGHPGVPGSPEGLLADGSVEQIQRALAERHLLGQHEQGRLDAPTSAAIRRFQKEEALADTGFPDRDTLKRLGIDPESAYAKPREDPR